MMTSKAADTIVRIAEKLGVGFAICLLLLFGIAWVGPNIARPLLDQKIEQDKADTIARMKLVDAFEKLSEASEDTSKTMEKVSFGIERLYENQKEIKANNAGNAEVIKRQAEDIKELLDVVRKKPDPVKPEQPKSN